MSIRRLDDSTINKIAAGEVIERPAAVVKELVENSLDAGARRVEVKIEAGAIVVTDDGSGMAPDDLALAVERHATSKIRAVEDLGRLDSYGFRGEALPAIAAVSDLTVRSRRESDEAGTYLRVVGGAIDGSGQEPMAAGTIVEVRRLFFNTPVRTKFLKTERTERQRMVAAVERLALGRPDVAFRCTLDGRLVLATPGGANQHQALLAVHGIETARGVYSCSAADQAGRRVDALVGGPSTARGGRRLQGVWINCRPVLSRGLLEAANNAYPLGLTPGRGYPLIHLHVHLPPAEVDANVHPTKAEVRLAATAELLSLVVRAVRAAQSGGDVTASTPTAAETARARPARPGTGSGRPDGLAMPPGAPDGHYVAEVPAAWRFGTGVLGELRPLGQSGFSWIVCDGPGGLYLIDQHAAHERVLYEQLSAGGGDCQATQLLAVPQPVELAASEYLTWQESQAELSAAGLSTEDFGGRTVLVRGLPVALLGGRVDGASLLREVLAALADEQTRHSALRPELQARRAVASCAAAVKASTRLAPAELQALLDALGRCREPLRCPHGRPTIICLRHEELAGRFGRT